MNRLLKLVVFSTSRSFLQNVVENHFNYKYLLQSKNSKVLLLIKAKLVKSLVSAVQQQSTCGQPSLEEIFKPTLILA